MLHSFSQKNHAAFNLKKHNATKNNRDSINLRLQYCDGEKQKGQILIPCEVLSQSQPGKPLRGVCLPGV